VDLRAPLVLSTHDLGRRPGSMRTLATVVPAPVDLGAELIGVPEGSELALDLRLEAVHEGVLVSGDVRCVVVGECGRCLGPVEGSLRVPIQELFWYPDVRDADGQDDEGLPALEGDLLDLEPILRDAVVTALPFQPVCRPDCPGLCSECGARLADVEQPHVHEQVDPRWAALRTLAASPATPPTKES
jgi:uncharacterized protein